MLRNLDAFPAKRGRFYLAPFLDLKREAELGGLVEATHLKITRRWLESDPCRAVSNFYERAGLNLRLKDALPYEQEDLIWGIDTLLGDPAPIPVEDPGIAVIGGQDPLIDSNVTKSFFPSNTILPDQGHRLEALRVALKLS